MITFKFKLKLLPEYDIWSYNSKNIKIKRKVDILIKKKCVGNILENCSQHWQNNQKEDASPYKVTLTYFWRKMSRNCTPLTFSIMIFYKLCPFFYLVPFCFNRYVKILFPNVTVTSPKSLVFISVTSQRVYASIYT